MRLKRPVVLAAILLLLLADADCIGLSPRIAAAQPPVPPAGASTMSNLRLQPLPSGTWRLTLDYVFNGQPEPAARISVQQEVLAAPQTQLQIVNQLDVRMAPGAHTINVEIERPQLGPTTTIVTKSILVTMYAPGPGPTRRLEQAIEWPDAATMAMDGYLASVPFETALKRAVDLIDSARKSDLREAKAILERMLEKNPKADAAYVELARVAMRTNWSAEGLRQSESLIGSALQIRPGSVNAKILLGYVYAHQKRFKEAETLFVEAARENPPNIWLWTNWGELLAMQGKPDAAVQKWREAIARPPTGDTYDRARQWAYAALLSAPGMRKEDAAYEALLKQRAAEYPATGCFRVDYARFLALHRADPAQALQTVRTVPATQCGALREVQGLAHYVAWSQGSGPERTESLLRARVLLPSGPVLFYQLASAERSASVVRALAGAGESLAVQDNERMDALSHALREGDTPAAERLLKLGAKPDALIGPQQMPVALLPVLMRDVEGIRLMRRSGVDYTKLRFQDQTALDYARQLGDRKLLDVLDPKSGAL